MRKLFSIAGAALMAVGTLATPVSASHVGTLNGSCGPVEGMYGMTNVADEMFPGGGDTVPALLYRIDYQGLPAGSTLGVIIRYNDELEDQRGVQNFSVANTNGMAVGALRANITPEAQGGGISFVRQQNHGGNKTPGSGPGANMGRSEPTSARRAGAFTSPQIGGGLQAGDYHFYAYLGEVRDTPAGRAFVANETQYVGKFSCGVTDD